MTSEIAFTIGDLDDAADCLDARSGGSLGDSVRAASAELCRAHGALESLAAIRDELRDHMANLGDKQPWDNRAMFERLLTALEAATKDQAT